jgi:hypothetical protein
MRLGKMKATTAASITTDPQHSKHANLRAKLRHYMRHSTLLSSDEEMSEATSGEGY